MSEMKDHGALLYRMIELRKAIFPKYNDEIYRILNKTDEVAGYADRADTLEGATPEQILAESLGLLRDHEANKNNPHSETVDSIGLLSGDNVVNQLKDKLLNGHSPIDVYGYDLTTWTRLDTSDLFSVSDSNITISKQDVIWKGVLYTIPQHTQNLATINSTWNNKRWYVYLLMVDGRLTIDFRDYYLGESHVLAYIGSIQTGPGTKTINPLVRVGDFRLSTAPLGTGVAVGLDGFDSTRGIDLGWRPGQSTVRPERPPKVDIWVVSYDTSTTGTNGYITTEDSLGQLLQVNQTIAPNVYFGIEGDGVTTSTSYVVESGANPTITKVSQTRYRITAPSYSKVAVKFTARNQYGDTESVTLRFEVRTNLSVKYGSATNSISTGTQGGLSLVSFRVNTDGRVHLALTGDGVTTSVARTNTSGSGAVVTRVNNTRYDVRGPIDNVMLLTFTATDRYGRTATMSMYVNVRTAIPPNGYISFWAFYISGAGGGYNGSSRPHEAYGRPDIYRVITYERGRKSDYSGGCFLTYDGESSPRYTSAPISVNALTVRKNGVYLETYTSGISSSGSVSYSGNANLRLTNTVGEIKNISIRTHVSIRRISAQSCFTWDTLILMSNGTSKQVVDIQIGDYVMGATGPTRVTDIDYPRLGDRKLLSFNGRCKTSPEHSIWSKCSKTGKEWWSTRDMNQWRLEARTDAGPDFGGVEPYDFSDFDTPHLYATLNGFEEHTTVVHHDADPSTQLYHLITEEGGTYFADGFLVSSMATSRNNIDWTKFKWAGEIQYNYPTREWRYPQQDRIESK